MNQQETHAIQRFNTIQQTSLFLTNEFLFCILYVLYKLNRPVTSKKLAKDLNTEESLLRDHLNILTQNGFVRYEKKKYGITDRGKSGVDYARESVNKSASRHKPSVMADLYSVAVNYQSQSTMTESHGIDTIIQGAGRGINGKGKESKTYDSGEVSFTTTRRETYGSATT